MKKRKQIISCGYCKKGNWHENVRCTWCYRAMPKNLSRGMVTIIVFVSMASIAGLFWMGSQMSW